jgi:hypothetical protein
MLLVEPIAFPLFNTRELRSSIGTLGDIFPLRQSGMKYRGGLLATVPTIWNEIELRATGATLGESAIWAMSYEGIPRHLRIPQSRRRTARVMQTIR